MIFSGDNDGTQRSSNYGYMKHLSYAINTNRHNTLGPVGMT